MTCSWSEQVEPALAQTSMETHHEGEALEQPQQEPRRSEDKKHHWLSDKAVPTTAKITSTSLLGKRHHSLYANLSGFDVEGKHKVSVE